MLSRMRHPNIVSFMVRHRPAGALAQVSGLRRCGLYAAEPAGSCLAASSSLSWCIVRLR